MSGYRILLVDDDATYRASIRRALTLDGHDVVEVGDGRECLELLMTDSGFQAIVLDVTMPDVDGFETCRRIRAAGDVTPVLMLTARTELADRLAGLDGGADDYLSKNVDLRELTSRVRACARRGTGAGASTGASLVDDVLRYGDVRLDPAAMELQRAGDEPVLLSRTEAALLGVLMSTPKRVFSRNELYERVWGADLTGTSNSLEVFVSTLRRKLEAGGRPRVIHTVRGAGYVIR